MEDIVVSFNDHNLQSYLARTRGASVFVRGTCADTFGGAVNIRRISVLRDRPVGGHAKRAIDVVLAAIALLVLAPMFLLITAVLYVSYGHPIFVAQRRLGFAGRRFTGYSFRTSSNDGAQDLADDPALTTTLVGWLRQSGLSGLPQLVSILRGDMSFVGPRPVEVGNPRPPSPHYFAARPGLLGMRHVDRLGDLRDRRRALHDRFYVRRWTIWLDLAVLARSFAPI
jgi:lipopolysaccharide/colanic/teichoic acid biosynthesis glycosyltransferase